MDEAGCGPWAGPVVAAAVVLRRRRLRVRIDDSKRLSPRQRAVAYEAICRHADIGIGIVPAGMIDTENIRRAALRAMQAALVDLPASPELVLVDGNQTPALAVPCWSVIDGDHLSYVIGCASIVAKVTRDCLMRFYHRLFPHYQFDQHKGYGTSLHLARLREHGPSVLHRLSFDPVSAVLSMEPPASPSRTPDDPCQQEPGLAEPSVAMG